MWLYWRDINSEGFKTLALRPSSILSSKERVRHIELCGVLVAYYIFATGTLPAVLSPLFIQAAIAGIDTIMDIQFVQTLAPVTAQLVRAWPLEHQSFNASTINPELQTFIIETFDMQPAELVGVSPDEWMDFSRAFYAKTFLDTLEADHPDLAVFRRGFATKISPTGPTFHDVCCLLDSP
jgi:hypothetical protein